MSAFVCLRLPVISQCFNNLKPLFCGVALFLVTLALGVGLSGFLRFDKLRNPKMTASGGLNGAANKQFWQSGIDNLNGQTTKHRHGLRGLQAAEWKKASAIHPANKVQEHGSRLPAPRAPCNGVPRVQLHVRLAFPVQRQTPRKTAPPVVLDTEGAARL